MSDTSGEDFNFFLTTHKWWLAKGPKAIHWVNTYEVNYPGPMTVDDPGLRELADDLNAFERLLHGTSVFIERINVATWHADSKPYNANEGKPIYYSNYGLRTMSGSEKVDLRQTYDVMREPSTGNPGRLKFRGVLCEADVIANEVGVSRLVTGSELAADGDHWTAAYVYLSKWVRGGVKATEWGAEMAMFGASATLGGNPETARIITQFIPVGVGFNPLDHKYYNKSVSE